MPIVIKKIGGRLDGIDADPRKTNANPTPQDAEPPLQLDRFFRNSKSPDATAANALAMAANASVIWRTRQVFVGTMTMSNAGLTSAGAGDRVRWRWNFRSSPYTHAIAGACLLAPPTANYTFNTRARIDLFSDVAESTLVTSQEMIYGNGPTGSTTASGYTYLREAYPYIEINPSTEYYCRAVDVDSGLMLSLCVFELCSLSENNNGYVAANQSVLSPIVDATTENLVSISNNVLQFGAATVLAFSVNASAAPVTVTSTTPANILDTSVTAVSASSPGWTIDLTRSDRLSQTTGVPCQVRVFGEWTFGGGPASGGSVFIKNSSGVTLASIVDGWSASGVGSWVSTTVTLPATSQKLDIHVSVGTSTGGFETFELHAVTIRQQG